MGFLFILVGLIWTGLFAFLHFRGVSKAKAARGWPTTTGTVRRSEVTQHVSHSRRHQGGKGVQINLGSAGANTTVSYKPVVVYDYVVAGVQHVSERVRFGALNTGAAAAQKVVNAYPVGATPMVSYDPDKPDEAVLEVTTPGPFMLIFAAAGLLFVVVGAVLAGSGA